MAQRDVNDRWANFIRARMRTEHIDGPSQLARESGIDQSVISRWLNEGRTPTVDALRRLMVPLNMPLRELLIAAGHATEEDLPHPSATNPRPEGEIDRRSVAELIEAGEAPLLSIDPEALRGLNDEQQAVVIREAQEAALRTARLLRGER